MAGRIRHKLADLLCQLTGAYFDADDIRQSNPMHILYDGVCVWDADGVLPAVDGLPARRIHVYSWDTMTACVRHGITRHRSPGERLEDWEISRNDPTTNNGRQPDDGQRSQAPQQGGEEAGRREG